MFAAAYLPHTFGGTESLACTTYRSQFDVFTWPKWIVIWWSLLPRQIKDYHYRWPSRPPESRICCKGQQSFLANRIHEIEATKGLMFHLIWNEKRYQCERESGFMSVCLVLFNLFQMKNCSIFKQKGRQQTQCSFPIHCVSWLELLAQS